MSDSGLTPAQQASIGTTVVTGVLGFILSTVLLCVIKRAALPILWQAVVRCCCCQHAENIRRLREVMTAPPPQTDAGTILSVPIPLALQLTELIESHSPRLGGRTIVSPAQSSNTSDHTIDILTGPELHSSMSTASISTLTTQQTSVVSKAVSVILAEWSGLGLSSQHLAAYIASARETIEAWLISKQAKIDTVQSQQLVTAVVQRLLTSFAGRLAGSSFGDELLAYAISELQVLTPTLIQDGFAIESEVAASCISCFGSKTTATTAGQLVHPLQSCDIVPPATPATAVSPVVSPQTTSAVISVMSPKSN